MPITASCGHQLDPDEEGVDVCYSGEDCDAIDGFAPAIYYAHFCQRCAAEWSAKGWLFESIEAAEKWLDEQPAPEPKLGRTNT